MLMHNSIACEIETMLDNINEECIYTHYKQSHMNKRYIVVRHNGLHPLLKAKLELLNFIKIEVNTINDKISKILVYLSMQDTPGVFGRCGL